MSLMAHSLHSMVKLKTGFTIIELLVVISSIAILAAISILAYSGVAAHAYNNKIISGVITYQEQIELYKVKYGIYPKTGPEISGSTISIVCVGTRYKNGTCGKVSGVTVNDDPTFDNTMSSFVQAALPAINDQSLPSGPEAYVGAVYGIDYTDSSLTGGYTRSRVIEYALNGANADCKILGAYSYRLTTTPPTTACEIFLEGITM